MELEEALFNFAQSQTEIVALIGEPNRLRLYQLKGEEKGKQPSTVQTRSGTGRQYRSCTVDGAVSVSIQLDHYGKTWRSASQLARAWRLALSPDNVTYPRWIGGGPGVGLKVKSAAIDNEFDLDDPEPGLIRRAQLWTFWVFET